MHLRFYTFLLFLIPSFGIKAQVDFPSLSPKGSITQVVGNTTMHIEYERPSVRGREIFGHLVPWNKIWRTGAAYCTKISFDKNVEVGGQPVKAGKYSLFTIPNKESWIIILNSDTTLYGSYDYDYKKDVARFAAKASHSQRHYETLTIDIDIIPNDAKIYISWDNVQVGFEVNTSLDDQLLNYINDLIDRENTTDPDQYGMAAEYLMYQNRDYHKAIALADKMEDQGGNNGWAANIRKEIYERQFLFEKALEEVSKSVEITKNFPYQKEGNRQRELIRLKEEERRIMEKLKRLK
jgi:tetratricopeptide (TPR) repeat protein